MKSVNNLDYFNIELKSSEIRTLLTIIIILVIILLFRKQFNNLLERIIVFGILFLLFLVLSKNLILTIFGSLIVFLLVNLIIKYRNTIEKFEDLNTEPVFDKNIFDTESFKKSADGIKNLLEKVNGGIELKDDDLKETGTIGIDTDKYKDDKKPNALKKAQKEAYELIDTVNALKDTVTTLAPVLEEGKKLMGIFENLKI